MRQDLNAAYWLDHGHGAGLVADVMREIESLTAEEAWYDSWRGRGQIPDYASLEGRLQELWKAELFDQLLAAGEHLLRLGNDQVDRAHDDGVNVASACDFFVVPSLTFKPLYCFVVLSHDRRRLLHVDVTHHPTDEWTAQQIAEAFPGDEPVPRFLHRDRDSIYGQACKRKLAALGIEPIISARKSPWQNPYAERVIGSIRRECTDHIIALRERHLLQTLLQYATYYNEARCHLSLEGNAPEPRPTENGLGEVIATPHLGGLHHRYGRAA